MYGLEDLLQIRASFVSRTEIWPQPPMFKDVQREVLSQILALCPGRCSLGKMRASVLVAHHSCHYGCTRLKASAEKTQGRLKLLIAAYKYPQSQILACWYPHTCQSVWGLLGKFSCSDFCSGLHWWTTKLCASVENWRVSRTGSFIHSVHSTFVHACALTWKY